MHSLSALNSLYLATVEAKRCSPICLVTKRKCSCTWSYRNCATARDCQHGFCLARTSASDSKRVGGPVGIKKQEMLTKYIFLSWDILSSLYLYDTKCSYICWPSWWEISLRKVKVWAKERRPRFSWTWCIYFVQYFTGSVNKAMMYLIKF